MLMLPYDKVPFTNELNQIIEPEQPILIITNSSHTLRVCRGTYLGLRRAGQQESVVVEMKLIRQVKRHKETDRAWDWKTDRFTGLPDPGYSLELHYPRRFNPLTQEQLADNERIKAEWTAAKAKYDAAYAEHEKQWHFVDETYHRRCTLQNNRIFPLSIKMDDFIKAI